MLSEISHTHTHTHRHLYTLSRVARFKERKWNGGCQRLRGMGSCFTVAEFQFYKMAAQCIYLTLPNTKDGKTVHFML